MFGRRFTLFRLMGFAVRVDMSWLIIVVLITWSLASSAFPQLYPGFERRTYWLMALVGALIFFASIIIHELSHAVVARRFGIPMKGITLFVFGGVAEMEDEPPSARAEFLMAAAGPATSIVLGALFLVTAAAGSRLGWSTQTVAVPHYLGLTNIILAVFNLIPAFPLDGGRILRALLWSRKGNIRRATRISSQVGSLFGLVLIALGLLALFTGNLISGIWWLLIGMFVRNAAAMSYRHLVVREILEGQPVRRFMTSDPITVPRAIPVSEFVHDYIYRHHHKMFPVMDEQRLMGCVTTREVRQLPREEWENTTVGSIAKPCQEGNSIPASAEAMEALTRMSKGGTSRLVVMEGDQLAGVITLKDLMRFLSVRMELEEEPPR